MSQISQEMRPVPAEQLQQGLAALQRRRNTMRIYLILSVLLAGLSIAAIIFHQQLIYALFEITPYIQQLHIPATADVIRQKVGEQHNYFGNLLIWLFWLGFKPFVAFIGAFVVLHYAKRWRFLQIRLLGFGKKVLGWLISFILIWSALTWVQHEIVDKDNLKQQYAEIVAYRNHIEQSRMYFYTQRSHLAEPINDYLLAQTALLREPTDLITAKIYMAKLIQEEKNNPNFVLQYDIQPQQLWAMEQQVYGQALTISSKSLQQNTPFIPQISEYSRIVLIGLTLILLVFVAIFFLLSRQLGKRLERIQTQLLKE